MLRNEDFSSLSPKYNQPSSTMRSLTYPMVCEYRKYLDQVRNLQKRRDKAYLNGSVDNLLPLETESKELHEMVLRLEEFYTYTDIKEQIMIFGRNI